MDILQGGYENWVIYVSIYHSGCPVSEASRLSRRHVWIVQVYVPSDTWQRSTQVADSLLTANLCWVRQHVLLIKAHTATATTPGLWFVTQCQPPRCPWSSSHKDLALSSISQGSSPGTVGNFCPSPLRTHGSSEDQQCLWCFPSSHFC